MLSDPYRCNFFMAKMHQKKGTIFVVPLISTKTIPIKNKNTPQVSLAG